MAGLGGENPSGPSLRAVTDTCIQMLAVVWLAVSADAEVRARFEQVKERNDRPTTEVQALERAGGSNGWNGTRRRPTGDCAQRVRWSSAAPSRPPAPADSEVGRYEPSTPAFHP